VYARASDPALLTGFGPDGPLILPRPSRWRVAAGFARKALRALLKGGREADGEFLFRAPPATALRHGNLVWMRKCTGGGIDARPDRVLSVLPSRAPRPICPSPTTGGPVPKIHEITFFQKFLGQMGAEAGARFAEDKPFSHPDCSRYLVDLGRVM